MKNLVNLLVIITVSFVHSQDNNQGVKHNLNDNLFNAGSSIRSSYGASMYILNPERNVEGSVYLFKDWQNYAIIHTNDKQKFVLRNINLNLERNTYESKIGQDSLFIFNFNNINKLAINSKVYKNYSYNDENRIFQIVYGNADFQLLKGFKIRLVKGSANQMLNRSSDKYVKKEYFYIRKDNEINPFKFRKKNILNLVDGNKEKAARIMKSAND